MADKKSAAKTGRPTKHNAEVERSAWNYVRGGFETEGDLVPTIEGLAVTLGISRKTIHEWRSVERGTFRDILETINAKQAKMLLSGSLGNKYNAQIAKLMLGKQGYHDRTETELTGPDGGPVETSNTITFVGVQKRRGDKSKTNG